MTALYLALAFLLSGAAGLIDQVVWGRMLGQSFGSTAPAVATVLAVFMAGLGIGAAAGGRVAERRSPRSCLGLYAGLELGVAASALASPLLLAAMPDAYAALARMVGYGGWPLATVRAGMTALALGPPTLLMGATLPLLVRAGRSAFGGTAARPVGLLYGANIFGAVIGSVAAGFLLIPGVGHRVTLGVAAALIVGAALAAAGAARAGDGDRAPAPEAARELDRGADAAATPPGRRLGLALGVVATGLTILAYEVLWTRLLGSLVGATVYALSAILATVLVALSLGSVAAGLLSRPGRSARGAFAALVIATPLSALATYHLAADLIRPGIGMLGEDGSAPWRLFGVPFLLAVPLAALPSLLSGAALPVGVRLLATRRDAAAATGWLYFANTAGSVAGALLTGLVLVPALGVRGAAVTAGALGASLAAVSVVLSTSGTGRWLAVAGAAFAVLGLAATAPTLDVRLYAGGTHLLSPRDRRLFAAEGAQVRLVRSEVLFAEEGAEATVLVERRYGKRALFIGGKPVATLDPLDRRNQALLGHLPALLQGAPERGLVVGLGTGMTAGALSAHCPVDVAELSDAVFRATAHFRDVNHDLPDNPRVEVTFEDGRTFLAARRRRYDVITVDPVHPYVAGAAVLYSRDYFAAVRSRLSETGVAAHWLPLTQMGVDDVRGILASFHAEFPDATVYLSGSDAVLIGHAGPGPPRPQRIMAAMARPEVRADLEPVWRDDPERLAALYSLGPEEVRRVTRGAAPIRDDRLWLEFTAPLHARASTPELLELLLAERRGPRLAATEAERRARRTYTALLEDFLAAWRSRASPAEARARSIARLEAVATRDPASREVRARLARLRGARPRGRAAP
ncbi:MAG: fused MFS/spermidine synthase [Sandaracinaceae bacterium]